MSKRFAFVPYDTASEQLDARIRECAAAYEEAINELSDGRAKSLALTALEESFMWCGKAIRDLQLSKEAL